MTPVVAIVGRANVGKSTLFNRLLEKRKALTSPEAGTTRDVNYGHFHWGGRTVTAIDTAGLDLTNDAATEVALKRQVRAAMTKSDIIIFLVNATAGLNTQDRALARELRRAGKPVMLAANKADNPKLRRLAEAPEWEKLGFGPTHPISAANGSGVGDLLDRLGEELGARGLDVKPLPPIDARIAIIGRPNTGKSTLLNSLAGEERCIVSEVPHTTKEPQDTLLTLRLPDGGEKNLLLIDTVGIRKRSRIEPGLESIGVRMTMTEIQEADVVFLMVDAAQGVDLQEKKLADLLAKENSGVLIVVNKWDLAEEKQLGTAEDYRKYVAAELPFFSWAPVTFIAAKNGSKVGRLPEYALEIAAERRREISTERLTVFAEKLKKIHHSAFRRGENRPKVYGLTQVSTEPPAFMLVVKDKDTLHHNFLRFVENRIRDEFGFSGTPIKVSAREITKQKHA